MTYPLPPAVPLVCKRCLSPLGLSRGTHVLVGSVRVYTRVVMTCNKCGHKRGWRPDRATIPARRNAAG